MVTAADLAKFLDELGQRLGPTGERVFQLAVRQVWIDGIMGLVMAALLAGIALAATLCIRRYQAAAWAKWNANPTSWPVLDGHPYQDVTVSGYALIVGCLVVVLIVAAFINVTASVPKLLNPEYAALRDLIRAVKP